MRNIEIGTGLIWVTKNLGIIYGVVTSIDFSKKIIEWENGRKTHFPVGSISIDIIFYLKHTNLKIDEAFYRDEKLKSIGF